MFDIQNFTQLIKSEAHKASQNYYYLILINQVLCQTNKNLIEAYDAATAVADDDDPSLNWVERERKRDRKSFCAHPFNQTKKGII